MFREKKIIFLCLFLIIFLSCGAYYWFFIKPQPYEITYSGNEEIIKELQENSSNTSEQINFGAQIQYINTEFPTIEVPHVLQWPVYSFEVERSSYGNPLDTSNVATYNLAGAERDEELFYLSKPLNEESDERNFWLSIREVEDNTDLENIRDEYIDAIKKINKDRGFTFLEKGNLRNVFSNSTGAYFLYEVGEYEFIEYFESYKTNKVLRFRGVTNKEGEINDFKTTIMYLRVR
ncbi:MAG: hypothetical protein ACOCQR_03220 [bacterium]